MATETLTVEKRTETGTLRMRRLRKTGQIPAILYGHGEDNVMLAVSEKELSRCIDHGSHIVQLSGAANESALIKKVQWDAFGSRVVHVDLTRVSESEAVEVTLPLEFKGEAPGTKSGGKLKIVQQQISIKCPADRIPDRIEVRLDSLGGDMSISTGEVILPEGATLAEHPGSPVAICSGGASNAKDEEE